MNPDSLACQVSRVGVLAGLTTRLDRREEHRCGIYRIAVDTTETIEQTA